MSEQRDPVRALEAIAEAAREYAKFVIFKPDRPATAARDRLHAALADYDDLIRPESGRSASTPAKRPEA